MRTQNVTEARTRGTARNLRLDAEMSEWLRVTSFTERRPATEIIRDSINLYRQAKEASAPGK